MTTLARRIVATVVAAVFGGLILCGVAGSASAAPAPDGPTDPALGFGGPDCQPDGVPNYAGSGLPGMIDDPVEKPSGKTLYGEYGWAGLRWTTCDLGTGPDMTADPEAKFDTMLGNWLLGAATMLGALMVELHEWAANPGEVMEPVDDIVTEITLLVRRVVWSEWGPVVILIAAGMIIAGANRGEMRSALRTIAALGVACLAMGWIAAGPTSAAQTFDGVVSKFVDGVDQDVLGITQDENMPAGEARGATFADKILYPIWERGQVGDDPDARKEYGRQFYELAAVKYADADDVDAEDRREEYGETAENVKDENPTWYDSVRGKSYNRTGYGGMALLMMVATAVIRIPAEALMVLGLLVVRLVVMFGPVFALAAIPEATRKVGSSSVKMVAASVVNAALFGMIASVHTGIVGALVRNSSSLEVAAFILCVLTVVIWIMSKPFRSITKPVDAASVGGRMEGLSDLPGNAVKQVAGSFLGSYMGSKSGTEEGMEESRHETEEGSYVDQRRQTVVFVRQEDFSRADDPDHVDSQRVDVDNEDAQADRPGLPPGNVRSTPPALSKGTGPDDDDSGDGGQDRPIPLDAKPSSEDDEVYVPPPRETTGDRVHVTTDPVELPVSRQEAKETGTGVGPGQQVVAGEVTEGDRGPAEYGGVRGPTEVEVEVPVRLVEPERDANGELTYEIFRPGQDDVSASTQAMVDNGRGERDA